MTRLGGLIQEATVTLTAAGVVSAEWDARELAAHVLGVDRGRLVMVEAMTGAQRDAFLELVRRRSSRVPLQHLTGVAWFAGVEVAVGEGVFVPRPETELLWEWAVRTTKGIERPVVVDLCTGSGALALAVAGSRPDADVYAVEIDPDALLWAGRNITGSRVTLYEGDVTDAGLLCDLTGSVDVVVANPPYIPLGTELEPEVADHDPHRALFGGPDGLDIIRAMAPVISRLLRPGGMTAIEHDDSNGAGVAAILRHHGFVDVSERRDLAGKPRFVVGGSEDVRIKG